MKILPACETCIKSKFLCASCEEKMKSGQISEFDLDIANTLLELETKYPALESVSLYQTIDFGDAVILVVGNSDKIRFSDEIQNELKKKYDLSYLIFIEKTNKLRPIIESLILSAKLISLNEIFLPTGETEYKAIIDKSDKEKILFTAEELEELIGELTGEIIRVKFN